MKCSLDISDFLDEISVFPFLLFSSVSFHCSLKKIFLSLLAILWNSAFRCVYPSFSPLPLLSFFFVFTQLFVRPPQTTILPFCISFSWGLFLIMASCTMSLTSIHSSSGTLSDLIPWIYLSLPLYNQKGFYSYLNGLVVFPTFLNLSLSFAIRSSWFESQSASSLVFADCIELLLLLL